MTTIGEMLKQYQEDSEIFVLEPGKYRLQVTGVKATKTDLRPVYKVVDGPFKGKRVMAGVLTLNGNAAGIFFQNMAGFGLKEDFFRGLGEVSTEDALKAAALALKGRIADIELVQDEWKGDPRNKIAIGKITLIEAPPQQTAQVAGAPVIPQQAGAPVLPQDTTVVPTSAPAPQVAAPQPPAPVAAAPAVAAAPVPPVAASETLTPVTEPAAQAQEAATTTTAPPVPSIPVDDPGF